MDEVPVACRWSPSGRPRAGNLGSLPVEPAHHLYWNRDGVPIGGQFAARYGGDAMLFRLAAQLDKARPWADRRPPVTAS